MTGMNGFRRVRCLAGYSLWIGFAWLVVLGCDSQAQTPTQSDSREPSKPIWMTREEIRSLPMRGAAWDALVAEARRPAAKPDLSDKDDPSNVRILAKALYYVRTGDVEFARQVERACEQIRGTEVKGNALAVSRELMTYVIAADLVGLEGEARERFEGWLREVQRRSFEGRTIRSTHEDRPNNWGTHAGATRIAIAAYLGDTAEVERAAHVFRGWTGEEEGWRGFKFGARWWQPEGSRNFAVNPQQAERAGHPIGGVLPDDQRRAGRFAWPPPKENYVYEALQGAVAQAVMLDRFGYDSWNWGDQAILRAFEWLYREADFPAVGDDTWLPPIVNRVYGTRFPAPTPSKPGKGMGFSDWTHARGPVTEPTAE